MNYWLIKSEPTSYSIDDLIKEKNKTTCWDGVRNYQARNFMRDEMKENDLTFFYHSSCQEPGIAGIVKVVREGYPDHSALNPDEHHYDPKSTLENPRWVMVDVQFQKKFSKLITLSALKNNPLLNDLLILRKGNRLSVTPVSKAHWKAIVAME